MRPCVECDGWVRSLSGMLPYRVLARSQQGAWGCFKDWLPSCGPSTLATILPFEKFQVLESSFGSLRVLTQGLNC